VITHSNRDLCRIGHWGVTAVIQASFNLGNGIGFSVLEVIDAA
jgi:UDP-glucose 4-epimerase